MRALGIAGAVPGAYSQEQTNDVARELQRAKALYEQAQTAQMQRQGPLHDQLLQAQINNLNRGPQWQQEQQGQLQAIQALMALGKQSGQMTPMPQPPQAGPSPFQGAQTMPTQPVPGVGAFGQIPPGFQASPQGGGGPPMLPLPPAAQASQQAPQTQPGPIQGAAPMPQPPQQGQGQQGLLTTENIMRAMQDPNVPPQAKVQLFGMLQQAQTQNRQAQVDTRQQAAEAERERHNRVQEERQDRQGSERTAAAIFDAQAARIRGDIMLTPEQKDAQIDQLGRRLGIPAYSTSQPTISPKDKSDLQAMITAKVGKFDVNDPDATNAALKPLVGNTLVLPSGKKYKFSQEPDGSIHYDLEK